MSETTDEPVFFAGPKESGKSALTAIGMPAFWICHVEEYDIHFMVLIGHNEERATDKVKFLRLELEHNRRLRQDYGDLKTNDLGKNDGQDQKKKEWIQYGPEKTQNGVAVS